MTELGKITRRRYLILRMLLDGGGSPFVAIEAIHSVAIEHPEWDLDEEKTWQEWEAEE